MNWTYEQALFSANKQNVFCGNISFFHRLSFLRYQYMTAWYMSSKCKLCCVNPKMCGYILVNITLNTNCTAVVICILIRTCLFTSQCGRSACCARRAFVAHMCPWPYSMTWYCGVRQCATLSKHSPGIYVSAILTGSYFFFFGLAKSESFTFCTSKKWNCIKIDWVLCVSYQNS